MTRIKKDLEEKVRRRAKYRCGYCQTPQDLLAYKLEIEHLFPRGLGGETVEENLWLACRECNSHKAMKIRARDPLTKKLVKLFNPRGQKWHQHFDFGEDFTRVIGLTVCGRATVESLKMNTDWQTNARRAWITTGKFPPKN